MKTLTTIALALVTSTAFAKIPYEPYYVPEFKGVKVHPRYLETGMNMERFLALDMRKGIYPPKGNVNGRVRLLPEIEHKVATAEKLSPELIEMIVTNTVKVKAN